MVYRQLGLRIASVLGINLILAGTPAISQAPSAGPVPAVANAGTTAPKFRRVIKVEMAALDQPIMWNRLGAAMPGGMVFALLRDVVPTAPQTVTINATADPNLAAPHNLAWDSSTPSLRAGDTVRWRIANDPANAAIHHGAMILDWDKAKAFLDIVPGALVFGPQPGFPAPAQGTPGDGTQGTVLLTAKVKSVPPGGATVPFEWTIHQQKMTGQLNLVAPVSPGKVMLRGAKRPRPIALRANVGDCLEIHFTNLLDPAPVHGSAATRYAGVHASGLELVDRIDSNGSWVGANPGATGGLVAPGKTKIYKYYAREEGTFLLYSGGDPSANQVTYGLFGAVNVQPVGAEWYRSQVTREDLLHRQQRPGQRAKRPDPESPERPGRRGEGPAERRPAVPAGAHQGGPPRKPERARGARLLRDADRQPEDALDDRHESGEVCRRSPV
jgi:hypothetical protein